MFPRELRSHMEAITFLTWSFAIMALTLYGYAFQAVHWRYLQLAIAAFSVYAIFEWWYVSLLYAHL